jgi:uncharacterized protein (DUF58 family)
MLSGRQLASSLTARGWGVCVGAVLFVVAGHIFGIAELYAAAAGAVAAVGYALAWAWTAQWRIDVGRRLQPGRLEAGQEALVVLTLQNRSGTTSPVLVLRDPLDKGRRTTELVVAPMEPGQRLSGSYQLDPAGRGVFTVGPLTLEATDPLGLARRVRSSRVVSTCVVHPRVERLRPVQVGTGTDHGTSAAGAATGRDTDEFSALREYQVGDDIRRMHWASTARTDTLMVREDQLDRLGQFNVILDTRPASWSPASFERAVSAAASVAGVALDAGLHCRVLTTDGADTGSGVGRPQQAKVLDMLARVELGGRGSYPVGRERPRVVVPLAAGGTAVIVTADGIDIDDLRRNAGLPAGTDLIAVVIAGKSHLTPARVPGAGRVVRVAAGSSLAASWDRLV